MKDPSLSVRGVFERAGDPGALVGVGLAGYHQINRHPHASQYFLQPHRFAVAADELGFHNQQIEIVGSGQLPKGC
jgi:hypothetical protein